MLSSEAADGFKAFFFRKRLMFSKVGTVLEQSKGIIQVLLGCLSKGPGFKLRNHFRVLSKCTISKR